MTPSAFTKVACPGAHGRHGFARRTRRPFGKHIDGQPRDANLRGSGDRRVWVQPVVVLWESFEQRSIESDGVAWVQGPDLAEVLTMRPPRLSTDDVARLTGALRRTVDFTRASRPRSRGPRATRPLGAAASPAIAQQSLRHVSVVPRISRRVFSIRRHGRRSAFTEGARASHGARRPRDGLRGL